MNPFKSGITAIVGHYGSGKSEVAINGAISIKEDSPDSAHVFLADLDVVNPYFRSREGTAVLEEKGIRVISTAESFPDVDLPYMPPELAGVLYSEEWIGILDIGGQKAGARVLPRYAALLKKRNADVYFVINASRPNNKTPEDVITCVQDISATSGLKITGFINNTHLCGETGIEEVEKGAILSELVSEETGIPVVAHTMERGLLKKLVDGEIIAPDFFQAVPMNKIMPLDINLKKPWETR